MTFARVMNTTEVAEAPAISDFFVNELCYWWYSKLLALPVNIVYWIFWCDGASDEKGKETCKYLLLAQFWVAGESSEKPILPKIGDADIIVSVSVFLSFCLCLSDSLSLIRSYVLLIKLLVLHPSCITHAQSRAVCVFGGAGFTEWSSARVRRAPWQPNLVGFHALTQRSSWLRGRTI